jgi:hypothetical protein
MGTQRISLDRIFGKIRLGTAFLAGLAVWVAAGEARAREYVAFSPSYPAGTIIIKQSERKLYFTTGAGTAERYPIAIGRAGKAWQGETFVQGKFVSPAWLAPWVVLRDHPKLSRAIPGGSPRNPMGRRGNYPEPLRSRNPRHQREHAQIRRHGRFLWLHPDV